MPGHVKPLESLTHIINLNSSSDVGQSAFQTICENAISPADCTAGLQQKSNYYYILRRRRKQKEKLVPAFLFGEAFTFRFRLFSFDD